MTKNKGFTLIELLVVIGLLGVVGAILVNTVFSTLRGSNKGDIVNSVRSDGNYVMQTMVRSLQNAESFQGASSDFTNNYTKPCPAAGASYKSIKINTTELVSCPNAATGDMGSFSSINTTRVSVFSCSITCSQSSDSDNPTYVINFTLKQGTTGKVSTGLLENSATINFSTSVRMRNPVQ